MLSGTYQYNIDLKGRLNFPARLREELGSEFVLAKSLQDPCLRVYSMAEWATLLEKIKVLPDSRAGSIKRQLLSCAVVVVPDKQGRILIPQNLMQYANLSKEATVIGMLDYCEVWDKPALEAQNQKESLESMRELLFELGL